MRAGKIDRVKRRLLREAVAENVDTIRGLPPRALRTANRIGRVWLKRTWLLLVPLTLAGSTYLTINGAPPAPPAMIAPKPLVLAPRTPSLATVAVADSMERVSASAFPLSVRRVIVDAGHGGNDPGASSLTKLSEKDITLDIAGRLRALLQKNGFEVIVTRPSDKFIPLRERAQIANTSRGDIFVSIHVNSVPHQESHGIETYFLGPTNDPTLTRLAADENRASGYSLADLRKLLDGVYADVRRDESHRLATDVQDQLYAGLRSSDPGVKNWGVKRAPFIVLVATEMPAVLAEVGCLSNPRESEMLGRPDYRQQIAVALSHGITTYATQQ